jgi:hypothetical protein
MEEDKFENKVSFLMSKREFDERFDTWPHSRWCKENVGKSYIPIEGYEDGLWSTSIKYLDPSDILFTFSFKKQEDALMFALSWSRNNG